MSKKTNRLPLPQTAREHCRRIFNDPEPPRHVWEPEFDYCDAELQALAAKDWRHIHAADLGRYYILNLVYHEPLQPDLFSYLFPICLAVWHEELMNNADFASGEFYVALRRPYLWGEMMDAQQRQAVSTFIVNTMIERLKLERGFVYAASKTPAYTWLSVLNSLGACLPLIEPLWTSWWTFDHPGKAVSAMMYASGLIYLPNENPIFGEWTRNHGGGAPDLVEMDFRLGGWLADNLSFLRHMLTADILIARMEQAANVLQHEPEGSLAARIAADARQRRDIITIQIDDLIEKLG